MPGGVIFEYKCPQGHRTDRRFPPATSYANRDATICPACLLKNETTVAYLIFARPEPPEKPNVGRSS